MLNNQLIVKKESAQTRCEICHQTDYFDVDTISCQLCKNMEIYAKTSISKTKLNQYEKLEYFRNLNKNINSSVNILLKTSYEEKLQHNIGLGIMFFNIISFIAVGILAEELTHSPVIVSITVYLLLNILELVTVRILDRNIVKEGIKEGIVTALMVMSILFIFIVVASLYSSSPM